MNRLLNTSLAFTLSLALAACGGGEPGHPAEDTASAGAVGDVADPPADDVVSGGAPMGPGTAPTPPAQEAPAGPQPSPAQPVPAPEPAPEPALEPTSEPVPQPVSPPEATGTAVSLADIRDKMLSDLGISDYMELTASRLLDLYGIQEADLAQSACFATMSGAFPGEVILVEAVDEDAASRIAGLLRSRLDEVLNQYKTYDAETYALAEACTVDTDGKVVSMLLSPERAEMRRILADSLG